MGDVWEFDPPVDSKTTYADGTVVPHRSWTVKLNGVVIGEIDIHTHKRLGPDGKTDVSYGATMVVFGPVAGGK